MSKAPRAFRLDDAKVVTSERGGEPPRLARGAVVVTQEPEGSIAGAMAETAAPARRRMPWLGLLVSALGGLATLAIGLWAENLVASLMALYPALGWLAAGLAGLAGLAFLAILIRETAGSLRERRIEGLRARAAAAWQTKDDAAARAVVADLVALYRARPDTARGRAAVADLGDAIIDATDRLGIAERQLLEPLDKAARRAIAMASKQVSVVTAISPRAIVDVAFVLYAAFRLIRRLAAIYGGRPGFFGFLRLGRNVLSHLAVTGGMAAGDSIVQQVLGFGLAARLSAKLGEGVLNGLLTARVGLAAMAVCRPLPFAALAAPAVGDVAGHLFEGKPADVAKGESAQSLAARIEREES
jgi:putative membrane protein